VTTETKDNSKRGVKSQRGHVWEPKALSRAQLARLLGVSGPTVTGWAKRGCPRNKDKTYSLADVCRWIREGALDLDKVPQTIILEVLGVTKPTLGEMHRRGMPRNRDKSYNVVRCVRWRIDELEERVRLAKQSSVLESARIRKMRSETQLREMDLAERRGQLLPRAAVVAGWVSRYQTLKAALQGLVGRLSQHGLTADQVDAVHAEIREMLQRLAGNQIALQLPDQPARILAALLAEGEPAEGAGEGDR